LQESFNSSEGNKKAQIADSLGSIYESYGRYDSAAGYYEYLAINDPGIEYFEKVGNAYYESFSFAMDREKAGQLGEKARSYFNKVLEKQPGRFDLRNKIAMTFVSSANPMQGIMMLRQILEEDPDNELANFNLGMLSIQSGQYKRAKEYFQKLIDVNPRNLKGQFYLGLSHYELGEKEEARKQFELVKSMDDDPAVIATVEGYLKELD
jgi:tetratricopeptide (TPR) repeat protein